MKVTIFGAGYVGLVTGACLAEAGHRVVCMDVDADKITALSRGTVGISEPGLEAVIRANLSAGRLSFTANIAEAVRSGDLLFIAVGTPERDNGQPNLSAVFEVAASIGRHMDAYKIVVDKSTAPVGTAERVRDTIADHLKQRGVTIAFDVCSNPEFLAEGSAIEDFTRSARIVVGTDSVLVRKRMQECYAPYNRNHNKLMFLDIRAAELTKYAANAMLATKISFMNEIANIAERLSVDVEQVRLGIGSDPRIGYDFIYPGCGYGGSCFPKDVRALALAGREANYRAELIEAVDAVNTRQRQVLFDKLQAAFDGELKGRTIAIWGLAFKPNTSDMREAPSGVLMEAARAAGARVRAYDPQAMREAERLYGQRDGLSFAATKEEAARGADALVVCTEWKEFRIVDFGWLKRELAHPIVIDGRNIYDPTAARAAGLLYYAIGR